MEGGGLQPYHVVDAFTSTPFAGNPAAVVLAPSFPADVRMHAIARCEETGAHREREREAS